ncbi:MAG TPA: DUF1489 domain-containing protein [Paracoccus sp.]|nr:DUF1489 domain-containing protein [Paracoccus sp. (in: a-proteobacteria)]
MTSPLHMLKLCVGAESVEDLVNWHDSQRARWPEGCTRHVTRMWPKRAGELLAGGSLYWVFKGVVLARQRLLRLEPVEGADGITRCGIIMDAAIIRTEPLPRRPFQGWRYLNPADAPRDLPAERPGDDSLPPELSAALADLGLR